MDESAILLVTKAKILVLLVERMKGSTTGFPDLCAIRSNKTDTFTCALLKDRREYKHVLTRICTRNFFIRCLTIIYKYLQYWNAKCSQSRGVQAFSIYEKQPRQALTKMKRIAKCLHSLFSFGRLFSLSVIRSLYLFLIFLVFFFFSFWIDPVVVSIILRNL